MGVSRLPQLDGPINLGNPAEISMLELAETVVAVCGSRSQISFGPLPPDDPTQRRPDVRLARELLGFEPHVGLREGIERTVAFFRERRERGTLRPPAPR
jgi:UDP-glucuronate decarboxylase